MSCWGYGIGAAILALLIGIVVGWLVASNVLKKQIKENPPITEQQIRELYRQTGKKLSESQVLRIMNSIKRQQD
ncbi:YneF family protein [Candidatus Mycoplasma haematohominis]|uniref:YneF family protein n=1 Tax=Candidatus Mycoplasma haematohominis TaxID=1494318 RepID=UPI001FEBE6B4|nr:YneF family protein [Candidatus Mycoplasma haemohominis]